ncbi:hypothetical protein [Streptomyces ipomoeae]|uniref:hypothetical protein n=1 Tax=Streptomyces ipomoeae TaxID=103232 RepID=UPI0011470ACC|nr:hypothetical protein [Streptomyces ipomoeae]MDX2938044.1 hypothetical protein [Streptomyces ipomoeae]TQE31554.1 hypothetical protein SipoB123_01435 [Streptomyces ipomoeae]
MRAAAGQLTYSGGYGAESVAGRFPELQGRLLMVASRVTGNTASGLGGGIHAAESAGLTADGGLVTFGTSVLDDAASSGGGIANFGSPLRLLTATPVVEGGVHPGINPIG